MYIPVIQKLILEILERVQQILGESIHTVQVSSCWCHNRTPAVALPPFLERIQISAVTH